MNIKIKTSILVFFFGASLANLLMFKGDNSLVSFLVGELIITFFAYDLAKTDYRFHIYQILLCYFYFSLCVTHSFSGFSFKSAYYTWSYVISLTHFIFLAVGYNSIKYSHGILTFYPRQNTLVFLYFLVSIALPLYQMSFEGSGLKYSDKYSISVEEHRANISILSFVYLTAVGYLKTFFLLIFSNPFIYGVYALISGLLGYIGSGIKAGVFTPCVTLLMIYQFYYKKITTRQMLILLPIGLMTVTFLIGTTAFRGNLSLKSLMSLDATKIYSSSKEFLNSPESSHIIYTANIIEKIDTGEMTFRYGFDFYRLILYPFKEHFDDFRYASYVEYAALMNKGKVIFAGTYIGLAGELYWNYGIFFFIFSYLMGFALKCFTNYAFSLKPFGIISYFALTHLITWRYYRGASSDLILFGSIYITSALIFFAILKLLRLKFPRLGRRLVKDNHQ